MANPKIEVEVGAKITDLQKKLNQVDKELDNTGKSFGKLNSFAVGALQGIAAAFSVGAVIQFGKAVLDTTAQFQKFEAVLTNTLGSGSEAQIALIQIQEFASKTPFAVNELTQAFVKLANQGFKPTVSELKSLGDLASSTGKSFDQLAEAVIDAQVGEFERLKEFGIRAQKSGDDVTFTFKGVETQVKATDEAIRGYILSLGEAEGVSGAMAGISETLGGKMSNLGDNIEQLKLAIGNQTSGIYAASIDWLNEFVSLATSAAKGVASIREEASFSKIGQVIKANRDEVLALADAYQKISPQSSEQESLAKAIADVSKFYREAATNSEAFVKQSYTRSELSQIIEGFDTLSKGVDTVKTNTDSQTESVKKLKRTYEEIIPILDQVLDRAGLERLDKFSQGAEAPISATSGKAETQGIIIPENLATNFETQADKIKIQIEELSGAFSGLGSLIGKAFDNPQLGSFLGEFLGFASKLIAANFKIATSSAIAGAASSAAATGPGAAFTLPAFVAGAVGLIASAFAAFGGGGGGSGTSGAGTSSVGSGGQFTGTGSNSFDPFKTFKIEVVGEISGEAIGFALKRSEEREN